MNEVSINKNKKLSEHFTLGELTKTSYHTLGGNIPSHVAIENLTRLCLWLELLREAPCSQRGQSLCVTGNPRHHYIRVSFGGS